MMRSISITRPALWGFFICIAAAALLMTGEYLSLYWINHTWEERRQDIGRDRAAVVVSAFESRVQELLVAAGGVTTDGSLTEQLSSNFPAGLVSGMGKLEVHRQREDITIDLVDPRGTVVAWTGRSTGLDYKSFFEIAPNDTFVVVSQVDLHTNLSVGVRTASADLFVVASRPLEMNFPISNRFVSSTSFSKELSSELGVEVRLLLPQDNTRSAEQTQHVNLKDLHGMTLLLATLPLPVIESETQLVESSFSGFVAIALSIGAVFLSMFVWAKLRMVSSSLARLLGNSFLVWGVRYAWLMLQFPSAQLGGVLFEPSVYGSPFGWGITGSVGETLLSCSALVLNALLLLKYGLSSEGRQLKDSASSPPGIKLIGAGGLILFALLVPLMMRGYGAAVRSFVFDSTFQYQDPTVLMPEFALLAMHFNILLLSLALLCIFLGLLGMMEKSLARFLGPPRRASGNLLLLSTALILALIIFAIVEGRPQVSYPVQAFIALLGISAYMWLTATDALGKKRTASLAMSFTVLIVLSFLVSAPVLDAKLHEKERQQIQTYAEELLRPVDAWLSFVVSDALRSVQAEYLKLAPAGELESVRNTNIAFSLWARTLMGREGYNSAVVVYDTRGEEVSRFSVGLSSYEQRELLTRVFEVDEEILQLLERKTGGATIKYYGIWGTLRRENDDVMGIVGLTLSASQRSLFRGEVAEPLRPISRERFESPFRKLFVSEYVNGLLTSSTDDRLFKALPLPPDVKAALEQTAGRLTWSTAQVQGKSLEVLFVRDQSDPRRVLAVGAESLDLRWHIFNLTKMFMVYAIVLAIGLLFLFVFDAYTHRSFRINFREKLLAAFILLTVVPFVLSGWYNRQLASERLEESITRELTQDLDLIQQRILNTVSDERDFEAGVTDDYCEVVASDYAVDFTIYRRSFLQASSRPELFSAAILDKRLPGSAFVHLVVLGQNYYRGTERIGEVEYVVGYRPLIVRGSLLGVLAVPALYRQKEIDEELAQRNAFILGVYAMVLGLVIAIGVVLANKFSKPLRDLSQAAQMIGRGNLDVRVQLTSDDEVGELVQSFNDMASELKQNRESLARVERELAWKEMAKQVAHEIKNPLTPMKLSIQHLRKAYEDHARDFGTILQNVSKTIMEQVDSLARIASEFSNFARMPDRKFSRVNVNEVLRETIDLFGDVEGIEFRTNFWHNAPVLVADKDELRRVFINIIRNSVQAMDKGGCITVDSEIRNQLCVIRIGDSGPGIPEDIRTKVFQPNFSTKSDGMGLGLAIAQKIVQDINGTIELHSEVDKGTTVEIKIPFTTGVDV